MQLQVPFDHSPKYDVPEHDPAGDSPPLRDADEYAAHLVDGSALDETVGVVDLEGVADFVAGEKDGGLEGRGGEDGLDLEGVEKMRTTLAGDLVLLVD